MLSLNDEIRSSAGDGKNALSTFSYTIEHTEASEEGVSLITLFRKPGAKPFTETEEKTARLVLQETVWLHREADGFENDQRLPNLFPQEQKVLRHLRSGKPRKEISESMKLSEATVATYTKNIFRKLGVHSHTELMKKFLNGENPRPPDD